MTKMIFTFITAVHLAALSQIESGDRDRIIGKDGEISRWQMTPEVVARQLKENPALRGRTPPLTPADLFRQPKLARIAAASEWEHWVQVFQKAYHRDPNLVELYMCWHRPSRPLTPRPKELERAQRFANLVEAMEKVQ